MVVGVRDGGGNAESDGSDDTCVVFEKSRDKTAD